MKCGMLRKRKAHIAGLLGLTPPAPVYPTYWQNKSAGERARMQQELSGGQIGFD